MPTATPIAVTPAELDAVAFDADGLVPAIVQEQGTGQVLMLAWMNVEALRRTLAEGRTWFWSRSRQEYWRKGDTSGDRQWVREAYYDCDVDALLVIVEQEGEGACHTGERTLLLPCLRQRRDSRARLSAATRSSSRRATSSSPWRATTRWSRSGARCSPISRPRCRRS